MSVPVEDLTTEDVIKHIVGCKALPSLPSVAMQILELTRDQSATSADIAQCVELDQALSGKILKTINSSFYGLTTPCPTISRAINYLGMNTVRSLVLGFSLVDSFGHPEGAEGFDLVAHWRRAMYGAVAARLISAQIPSCDGDEAFIAAMLRDVGSLAATIAIGETYTALFVETEGIHNTLGRMETEEYGANHTRFGAELAARWKIPDPLVEAIAHHHDSPDHAPGSPLVRSVYFASLAADAMSENSKEATSSLARLRRLSSSWFSMDEAELNSFLEELKQSGGELARLFNIDTGSPPDIDGILDAAEEQKLQLQIAQEREAQELRESNNELAKQRFTDGLTGVQNRAAFDEALARAYREAEEDGRSLTIAFSDADKFKTLNDTHGHQAGDAVLIELASRMKSAVGDSGRVFRYGGEEFAFLCQDLSIGESVHMAERVRELIAATPFSLEGLADTPDEIPVTLSIGVAVYNEETRDQFADAEAILKCADDAVYTAKESGRNQTCLFDAEAHSTPATPPTTAEGKLRVLVVDDDPLLLKLLSTSFEATGLAEVRTVKTVAEAVKLLHFPTGDEAYVPHLVVTDLNMPAHSGVKLVRFMRATKALMTVPVLVLSGSDQDKDVRECLRAGANAYVPKSAFSADPRAAAIKVLDFWAIAAQAAA